MSLARAFTARRAKDTGDTVKRNNTLSKSPSQQQVRQKISAPVELVHTTNMLSYNAPDLPRPRNMSDASRSQVAQDALRTAYKGPDVPRSFNEAGTSRWPQRNDIRSTKPESDSDNSRTPSSTPPTSPDDELPIQPNHLSSYFMTPGKPLVPSDAAPVGHKRGPSHSKKNSVEAVIRKASIRMSEQSFSTKNSTFSRTPSTSTRASTLSHSSPAIPPVHYGKMPPPPIPPTAPALDLPIRPVLEEDELPIHNLPVLQEDRLPIHNRPPPKPTSHPFGQELAQVTELAEQFASTGRINIFHEDDQYITTHGLAKMSADDYLNEIHSIMAQFFPERNVPSGSLPMEVPVPTVPVVPAVKAAASSAWI